MERSGGTRSLRTLGVAIASLMVVALAAAPQVGTAEETFNNGTAKAAALVAKVVPGVGSLELGVSTGIAVAETVNSLAQAQAQALDFGLIGTAATTSACGDPIARPDQLPQPVRVDNRDGDAEGTEDEVPLAGSAFGVGRKHAHATTVPSSGAVATTAALEIGPVLTIGAAQSTADAAVIPGEGREAWSASEMDITVAGAVRLQGLRWSALHRTGADPTVEGAFEVARATIAGLPIPTADLGALEQAINTALAPTGISISLPAVEHLTEPSDLIRVTPLRILLKDSPIGKALLGPVLDLTRDQRVQLFDDLVAIYCDLGTVLLIGDITTSVLAGTGFFSVELGGVEAASADLVLFDPFASGEGGTLPSVVLPPGADDATVAGVTTSRPVADPAPALPADAGEVAAPSIGQPVPASASGPVERVCETVHPNGSPGCSRGAAATVGLMGLIAAAGVAALDIRRQRRMRARTATQ